MFGRDSAWAIAFALIAAPAAATDLPVRMPVKTIPVAAPGHAWAGFYVGAHAGYAFSSDRYSFDRTIVDEETGLSSIALFGSRGLSGGLLAGYNILLDKRWLAGIEVDASAQNIKTRATTDPAYRDYVDASLKQKWAASVRGRLGYLVTPTTLVYAAVGWAWSNADGTVTADGTFNASASISGFQGGFGVETAMTPNWRLRLEYLQTFYKGNTTEPVTELSGEVDIKPTVGLARAAAIYQFGTPGPNAPAVVAAAPNWTGFYLGGALGAAVGFGNVHFDGIGDLKGVALTGPMPSLLAGVNYQIAPRWVVGVEAEIAPSIRSTDLKLGWLGAVRGRVGYLLTPDTMIYGTAGWLGTEIDDLVYRGEVAVPGQSINGLQIGGGIEAALAAQWGVRFDYQYSLMQSIDLTFPSVTSERVTASTAPTGHIGRIALLWRFGN